MAALGAGLKVVAEWKGADLMAHSEAGDLFQSGVEEAALVSLALLVGGYCDFYLACMWSAMPYLFLLHNHTRKPTNTHCVLSLLSAAELMHRWSRLTSSCTEQLDATRCINAQA